MKHNKVEPEKEFLREEIAVAENNGELSEKLLLKAQELYIYGLCSLDKISKALKIPRELLKNWCIELNWDKKKQKFLREVQREIHSITKKKIANWVTEMDKYLTLVIGSVSSNIKEQGLQVSSAEAGWNIILKAIGEKLRILQMLSSNIENSLIDLNSLDLTLISGSTALPEESLTRKIQQLQKEVEEITGEEERDVDEG